VAKQAPQVRAVATSAGQNRIEMIMDTSNPSERPWQETRQIPRVEEIFEPLLLHISVSDDIYEPSTLATYQAVLNCIVGIYHAVRSGSPVSVQAEHIRTFYTAIPADYLRLVEQSQPRALVVLVYFFAVVVRSQAFWTLDSMPGVPGGPTGHLREWIKREVWACERFLTEEWHGLLEWAVLEVGQR
jgi:hypothetical protein